MQLLVVGLEEAVYILGDQIFDLSWTQLELDWALPAMFGLCWALPAMQETQVQSLGGEDSPGEGMSTHSSILAWKIPWTEEPGGLQSMGSQRVGHNLATKPTPKKE